MAKPTARDREAETLLRKNAEVAPGTAATSAGAVARQIAWNRQMNAIVKQAKKDAERRKEGGDAP